MFTGLFFTLREEGLPVSLTEWMTLMEALDKGLSGPGLTGFYHLARAVLVKSENHYDRFDLAFARYFREVETSPELAARVARWLEKSLPPLRVEPGARAPAPSWNLDEMRRALADRLARQDGEHHGGSRWIGTGGTSSFGYGGYHPAGLRIGGQSVNRSAVQVAARRHYRDYRTDETLTTRQFAVALRKLRILSQNEGGPKDELDLEATIDATGRNAGRLDLVFTRPRRNTVKLVLMMDSGGSMNPYLNLCSQLFQAARSANHFKEIRFYFFHNCVYDRLFLDPFCRPAQSESTLDVLRRLSGEYMLIMVGDASMAVSELLMAGGAVDWMEYNEETGRVWLERLIRRFPRAVWLNPIPRNMWPVDEGRETIALIGRIFPMFELTIDGLEQAIKVLKARR
ncbi:vWA domain-containing protein [Desulfotomaculum copahuensis]|uniref:VWA containing CoxE family protein n=1 Tax=Desulfotomaculum copahuensis TaxID=1838280 RepID=A0A1B7LHP4_9FIRM|nr:VWA domain-containing protein [Desulfotomaculum copahuensis]OAT85820.1 VWA containing CoxE family protein [Desulfotomaculum copahuensis]